MEIRKEQQTEESPTVVEFLEHLLKPGTVLQFPEKSIIFKNSPQSAVKSLVVNICSTESIDMAVLHQLHTQTRI